LKTLAAVTGLTQRAYPELFELAPHEQGRPRMVGPFTQLPCEADFGGVREVGFRKIDQRLVPIVHAKIMLLGRMGWTDEHPSGHVVDDLHFVPERLWIGSANFTQTSRQSLEMGMWTTDARLLRAARIWLLGLVSISEPLAVGADDADPELMPVAYDDDAIMEYFREVGAPAYDPDLPVDGED